MFFMPHWTHGWKGREVGSAETGGAAACEHALCFYAARTHVLHTRAHERACARMARTKAHTRGARALDELREAGGHEPGGDVTDNGYVLP